MVALAFRAVPYRSAAQSPAARIALEDPRQSAAQPDGAGDGCRAPPWLDRPAGYSGRMDGVRVSLQLAFLANHAYEMLHAITVTLVRLGITKHRLLEWETAAASAHRGGPPRLSVFVKEMIASPLIAVGSLACRPDSSSRL